MEIKTLTLNISTVEITSNPSSIIVRGISKIDPSSKSHVFTNYEFKSIN